MTKPGIDGHPRYEEKSTRGRFKELVTRFLTKDTTETDREIRRLYTYVLEGEGEASDRIVRAYQAENALEVRDLYNRDQGESIIIAKPNAAGDNDYVFIPSGAQLDRNDPADSPCVVFQSPYTQTAVGARSYDNGARLSEGPLKGYRYALAGLRQSGLNLQTDQLSVRRQTDPRVVFGSRSSSKIIHAQPLKDSGVDDYSELIGGRELNGQEPHAQELAILRM